MAIRTEKERESYWRRSLRASFFNSCEYICILFNKQAQVSYWVNWNYLIMILLLLYLIVLKDYYIIIYYTNTYTFVTNVFGVVHSGISNKAHPLWCQNQRYKVLQVVNKTCCRLNFISQFKLLLGPRSVKRSWMWQTLVLQVPVMEMRSL